MITITRGDTPNVEVTVTDKNGIFDLTGWTGRMSVKETLTSTTVYFTADGVIDSPTTGIIVFSLTSTQTDLPAGHYVYDVEIKKETFVHTVISGSIEVEKDVTP